jgi:hypothetical protein
MHGYRIPSAEEQGWCRPCSELLLLITAGSTLGGTAAMPFGEACSATTSSSSKMPSSRSRFHRLYCP